MKAEELRALIADIEDLGDPELEARSGAQQKNWERMLSDKVLLACTKWRMHLEVWIDPKGHQQADRPSPLTSLEDAKLAVPEGWEAELALKRGFARCHDYNTQFPCFEVEVPNEPAHALVLAGLKARLAEMEQSNDQ